MNNAPLMSKLKGNQNRLSKLKNEGLVKEIVQKKLLSMNNTTLSIIIFHSKIWFYSMQTFCYFL